MAMPAAPVGADIAPPSLGVRRDPLPARLLSLVLFSAFLAIVLASSEQWPALRDRWKILIFWIALMLVIDFFPIHIGSATLTLDTSILLAVAVSETPMAAALVAFVGSLDTRELRGEVSLSQAIFNRSQIALCIFLAALTFRLVAPELEASGWALLGMAVAVGTEFSSNVLIVSLYQKLLRGVLFRAILRRLVLGQRAQFLFVYLGYGVLALALALLSADVGLWAVALFLVPIFVARQALVRFSELQQVRNELRDRDQIVRSMHEKIVEERRDERLRIAGELHDGLLQVLSHIHQLGDRIRLSDLVEDAFIQDLEELRGVSERATIELREVIHDLRESPLGRGGLVPTLRGLLTDMRLEHAIRIIESLPANCTAPRRVQVALYQVAREALLNAIQHANADLITVELSEASDRSLMLRVRDDGCGLDLGQVDRSSHFGLALAQERVAAIAGTLHVYSVPGEGTEIVVMVPQEGVDPQLEST